MGDEGNTEIVGKIKKKINVYELNSPVKKHFQNKKILAICSLWEKFKFIDGEMWNLMESIYRYQIKSNEMKSDIIIIVAC